MVPGLEPAKCKGSRTKNCGMTMYPYEKHGANIRNKIYLDETGTYQYTQEVEEAITGMRTDYGPVQCYLQLKEVLSDHQRKQDEEECMEKSKEYTGN